MGQKIFAHRGASGYAPENTMRAFALACDMKAHGVELDVQLTRDRQVVVIHDETTDRVTGVKGRVAEMTYAELAKLSVINAVDGRETDRIPLLKDVLALLKERGLEVNIELKNSVLPYEGMEEIVMQLVEEAGMKEHTIYSSFNHYSLAVVKSIDRSAKCGLLYSCMLYEPWRYAASFGMDALHPHFLELRVPGEVEKSHHLGLMVNPWTVNSETDLRSVIAAGADCIITNYPDVALRLLEENQG